MDRSSKGVVCDSGFNFVVICILVGDRDESCNVLLPLRLKNGFYATFECLFYFYYMSSSLLQHFVVKLNYLKMYVG